MHSVNVYEDLPYYSGSGYHQKKHCLDLYIPRSAADFDTVMFIHGGAWKIGDKSMHAHIGRTLAQKGIGSAVINYRLSPEVIYPDHILDVSRAAFWVMNTIHEYGGVETRIFLMGHSAGAHLGALLTLHPSYGTMQHIHSFTGVICISGIYDLPSLMKTAFGRSIILPAFGDDPRVWNDASPIYHISTPRPPFFLMVAEKDPSLLKTQALRFKKALKKAHYYEMPGKNHFNSIWDFGKENDPTTKQVVSFIRDL